MRISLMVWKQVILYMKGDHRQVKPKKAPSSRMIMITELIGKYLLAFLFVTGILLTALAALGMSDVIIGGFIDGLSKNASFIIFIISLVIIAYVVARFLTSFFEDMKTKTTRFRPEIGRPCL